MSFRRSTRVSEGPPALPPSRTLTVRAVDGTELHAEVFGPPDGYPIVLTHGITCAVRAWAYQIAELRFQQGASTHLELVDSRVQLEQALLNQARSARDLRVARLRQELLPGLPLGSAAGF